MVIYFDATCMPNNQRSQWARKLPLNSTMLSWVTSVLLAHCSSSTSLSDCDTTVLSTRYSVYDVHIPSFAMWSRPMVHASSAPAWLPLSSAVLQL